MEKVGLFTDIGGMPPLIEIYTPILSISSMGWMAIPHPHTMFSHALPMEHVFHGAKRQLEGVSTYRHDRLSWTDCDAGPVREK